MKVKKYLKNPMHLGLKIQLWLLIVLMLVLILILYGYSIRKQTVEERMDNEFKEVMLEMEQIESESSFALITVSSLLKNSNLVDKDISFERLTRIWIDFLNSNEALHGFSGVFNNDTQVMLERSRLEGYLRVIRRNSDSLLFQKLIEREGEIIVKNSWTKQLTDKELSRWNSDLYSNVEGVAFSSFYISEVLNEPVLSVTKQSLKKDSQIHKLSVKVSLRGMLRRCSKIKGKDSHVILSDDSDKTMMIEDQRLEELNRYTTTLRVKEKMIEPFLNLTLRKDLFPITPIRYRYNGKWLFGEWSIFRMGNKQYRIGIVAQQDSSGYGVYAMAFAILIVVVIICVTFLLLKKDKALASIKDTASLKLIDSKPDPISDRDEVERIKSEVCLFFKNEKPYLLVDCSLGLISKRLNIDREVISNVVKVAYNKTVRELINDYRIEAAVHFFNKDEMRGSYSLDHLAGEFGYNSRTTFYREFKKRTGYSPGEYQMFRGRLLER